MIKKFSKKKLINKIKEHNIKIGIVGLGYVGLPLAHAFSTKNLEVIGFDQDEKKIKLLRSGNSYISYFSKKKIRDIVNKKFTCYNSFEKISDVDIIILCLPTPLTKQKTPDMSFIKKSMREIKKYLKPGQLLSLESTTYPGTCREVLLPFLDKRFLIGSNFFLTYSPEREDPGNKKYSISNLPKILGGITTNCADIGSKLYSLLNIKVIKVKSIEIAEFTKLLENIYRSVNIGLVNELKYITAKLNVNIFEVINSAKTKPFGFQAFYPGPGYGGHCIPIDPFLLSWKAKQLNMKTEFIELSGKINNGLPNKIVKKCLSITKKDKNKKVLIIGAAYKKNVDDMRESPSLAIMQGFLKNNVKFEYHDPYIDEISKLRNYNFKKKSINLTSKNIKKFYITLIVTDHDIINYNLLLKNSKIIIDTRGKFFNNSSDKIISI